MFSSRVKNQSGFEVFLNAPTKLLGIRSDFAASSCATELCTHHLFIPVLFHMVLFFEGTPQNANPSNSAKRRQFGSTVNKNGCYGFGRVYMPKKRHP